jgi:hypothetical protein
MQDMDPTNFYDEFPDHYSIQGGIQTAMPREATFVKSTASPRQCAQKAIDFFLKMKPRTNAFEGGKWVHLEKFGVVVIEPPCGSFYVCYHDESVRMFRSVTKKSSAITPSPLRTIVDPIRPWLVDLFKTVIPGGKDLLAVERGDTSALDRRAAEKRKKKESDRLAKAAATEAAQKAAQPEPQKTTKTIQPRRIQSMALLDVETSTKRVILETRTHSINISRKQFLGLLKSAGADIPKHAKLTVVDSAGDVYDLFALDTSEKIVVEWKVEAETEETA